ncbi:hypothetical protein CA51_21140 [Rosistilla oblonga]|nr:hypothetical protein CA51_21140 [Rosistilla oblonga]
MYVGSHITEFAPYSLESERASRLDNECRARQKVSAESRRTIVKEKKEIEETRRTELMAFIKSWETSQRIRNYLDTVEKTLEKKEVAPSKPEEFALWLDWAHWYADDICPLTQPRLHNESVEVPENCLVADIDLTSSTREAMQGFPETTTDELFRVIKDEFRNRCHHAHWSIYQEVTLVQEGLGYDVSQRNTGY